MRGRTLHMSMPTCALPKTLMIATLHSCTGMKYNKISDHALHSVCRNCYRQNPVSSFCTCLSNNLVHHLQKKKKMGSFFTLGSWVMFGGNDWCVFPPCTCGRFKRENFYDPDKLYEISPFRVTDLCVNSILFRANRDLRWLALQLGKTDAVAEIEGWLDNGFEGFKKLWDEEAGLFKCQDQITGKLEDAAISAAFLPLFAGITIYSTFLTTKDTKIFTLERKEKKTHKPINPNMNPNSRSIKERRIFIDIIPGCVVGGKNRRGNKGASSQTCRESQYMVEACEILCA